jgi:hypothetical protein
MLWRLRSESKTPENEALFAFFMLGDGVAYPGMYPEKMISYSPANPGNIKFFSGVRLLAPNGALSFEIVGRIAIGTESTMISFKDAATLFIALTGAVLGIINLWRSISHDKPKIKVTPKRVFPVGAADSRINFSIEAVNLGAVAVTICELGLLHHGTKGRSSLIQPIIFDGGDWPRRLEPRTSITVFGRTDLIKGRETPIQCAYAMTDCGLTFKGNSGALKAISRALATGQPVE